MKTEMPFLTRRIAIRAALVALVAAVCWILIPGEPSFERRTLSQWVFGSSDGEEEPENYQRRADNYERAIRGMGNRAVDAALEWLEKEDGRLTKKVLDFVGRHFDWHPERRSAVNYHDAAVNVFRILGPEARPAVPKLVSLAQSHPRTTVRIRAISALGELGPMAEDAVPSLLVCLDDADPKLRMEAALSLGSIGRQPAVVVPRLLGCLEDTNRFDVTILLYAFLRFTNDSAQVVPALEFHLQRANTAQAAANVILHFGPEADWPLARALTHPEAKVRVVAAAALMQTQRRRSQFLPSTGERLRVRSNLQNMTVHMVAANDRSRFMVARALALNLNHPDPELRHYFADLLVEFSDEATVALPEVIQALSSDDIYVAFRAWMVFEQMPLDEVEIVSPLPRGRRSRR